LAAQTAGSRRGVGHGGLPVLRASTAEPLTTSRLPVACRVQSPDANDLDRLDSEIIPAGFGYAGFCRERGGDGSTAPYFWRRLGSETARCAVLLDEGINEDVGSPLQGAEERDRFEQALVPH